MGERVNYIQWGKEIVRQIEIHHTLGSTNEFGKSAPQKWGYVRNSVVGFGAEKGRGRRGRAWVSDQGSLTFSLIWRCPNPVLPSALTLTVGLGLVLELQQLVPELKVKWPNDLWIGEKKLGGILTETVRQAGQLWVILGVGLNVNSTPQAEVSPRTSLQEASGCLWPRLGILHCALKGVELGFELADRGCNLCSVPQAWELPPPPPAGVQGPGELRRQGQGCAARRTPAPGECQGTAGLSTR